MKHAYLLLLVGIVSLPVFGAPPVQKAYGPQSAGPRASAAAVGAAERVDTVRIMGMAVGLRHADTSALRKEAAEGDSGLWDEFSLPADAHDSRCAEAPLLDSRLAQGAAARPEGSEAAVEAVPARGVKPDQSAARVLAAAQPRQIGVSYFSLKYRPSDNQSGIGIEYDYLKQLSPRRLNGCYFGGSFDVSIDSRREIGGGLSAGWPIELYNWFQVIPGGSVGYWAFDARGRRWGDYDAYFAIGGPFVRLLIGSGKHWLDVSDRLLFGDRALNQIMFGYAYTWARGEQQ